MNTERVAHITFPSLSIGVEGHGNSSLTPPCRMKVKGPKGQREVVNLIFFYKKKNLKVNVLSIFVKNSLLAMELRKSRCLVGRFLF